MLIAKQMDIRSNIEKYFDIAYDGEAVIVPRKQDRNVVIISEAEYNRLSSVARISSYAQALSSSDKNARVIAERGDDLRLHNLKKLGNIRRMKKNWNGNNAPAFPASLIDKIESIVSDLLIQPEVFPTALKTIQLEYDNSRKDHLEIEIGESDVAEVFMIRFNGEESYESIPTTASAINERIGRFYG